MKSYRFLSLLTVLLVLDIAGLRADAVTPEQATQIASQFFSNKGPRRMQSSARRTSAQSAMTTVAVFDSIDSAGQPYIYAVSAPQQDGFVLVSGDDRFNAVLGYSDGSSYDEQTMPENMRAWMQGYIAEMRYLESKGYRSAPLRSASPKAAISPLLTTKWNQGAPFNNNCPIDNSTQQRSVTGCVATAMAQVINYHIQNHNAPTQIVAAIPGYTTYTRGMYVGGIAAGTKLPAASYLIDDYANNAGTDDQKLAVANLMLYCGVAMNMDYTFTGSGVAGSPAQALKTYFGFDSTTRRAERKNFTYQHWMNIIYDELAAGRPVYHSGATATGGHAFVIDGYDGDGLFHVNWGWGGSCDDYFALSVMNPDDNNNIGASTSNDGYTIDQQVVIGVQIGSGESYTEPELLTMDTYNVNGQNAVFNGANFTGVTHSWTAALAIIDDDGTINQIGGTVPFNLDYGYFSTVELTVPTNTDLAGQTKRIVPVCRLNEEPQGVWHTGPSPDINYWQAVYDANGVPTLTVHPIYNLSGVISVPSNKFVNETQTIQLQVTNSADEFYGQIYLFASTTENKGAYVTQLGLISLANSTETVQFEWTPTAAGTYNLWVATSTDGSNVIATGSVTIVNDPSLTGKTLVMTACSFENTDATSAQIDASGIRSVDVYGDRLKGSVTVKNISNSQFGPLNLGVRIEKYNTSTQQYDSDPVLGYYPDFSLQAGKSVNLGIERTSLETDNTYRIRFLNCSVNPNVELEARYVFHLRTLTNYTISYNLVGGSVSEANPTSYNVLSNAIRLNNPTRTGYTFAGWTGTDLDHPTMTVTIPKGSTGNRSYTATWTPNIYVITWQMDDGSLIDTTHVAYDQMPTHSAPVKPNTDEYRYDFAGWSPTPAAATGNAIYTATFTATPYATITQAPEAIANLVYNGTAQTLITAGIANGGTMQYKLGDGAWSTSLPAATDPGRYTVYYRAQADASHADREGGSLTAYINYRIDYYNLEDATVSNPNCYNEDTETFTLNNPTRDGYTFTGWTGTGLSEPTTSVTIEQGSTGNRIYSAHWEAKPVATCTVAPAAIEGLKFSWAYLDLITAGETNEGTVQYKNGEGDSWSTYLPRQAEAGEYHIFYRIAGDENHSNSEPVEIVVTIAKVAVTVTTNPVVATKLTYTGNPQPMVTTAGETKVGPDGEMHEGTFMYQLNDGEWNAVIPTATAIGEYTVSYKVVGDKNHLDTEVTGPITVYILPAPTITHTTVTWDTTNALRPKEDGGICIVSQTYGDGSYGGVHASGIGDSRLAKEDFGLSGYLISANAQDNNRFTFDTELGNFTRIEVNTTSSDISRWSGWTITETATVWTGNTNTVNLDKQGAFRQFTQIVFYIENVYQPKLPAEVTQAPEAQVYDYDGEQHVLLTAGTANHGTMAYRIGTEGEWSSELPTTSQAGNYDIYYKAVSNNPNYDDSEVLGPLYASIAPASLRITAGDAFILAGSRIPDVTVEYDGFISGEDEDVLFGTLTIESGYTDVGGVYDLTPGGVSSPNYIIHFVPGTLTVRGSVFKTFRINYDTYVSLSPSNLQYDLTNSTWRLAEHPWTVIGAAEGNTSESGWRDLIGWEAAMALDFGESGWRMLTGDEWKYIFEDRYNAAELSALATVHGQHGLILLPDGMETPPVNLNTSTQNFDANILTDAQWSALEYAGAVFLPTAGYRTGTETKDVVEHGYYWSTSLKDANTPYVARFFNSNYPGPHGKEYTTKSYGCSVRMIKTMPSATVTVDPAGKGDVIYTGETIELVTPGATEDGVIAYKVGYYGTWSTDIPVASEKGEYTIYYKVLGDAAHADGSERYAGQTIITKPRAVVTSAPTAVEGLIYTGEPQALVTHGTATGGTIVYSFDYNSNYSDTIPKATASGYYGVFWKAAGDADHADSGEPSLIHVYIGYGITYDLAGGTVETPNPTYYNGGMSSFTLNNPTREGYTFTGWTGSNGDAPEIVVTIVPYEHSGTLSYTANWTQNTPTAIDPITGNPLPVTEKVLIDDQIYIIRGGKVYTLQGLEVK